MAAVSLAIAVLCAAWIVFDELARPQRMGVMNLVWPITALYSGPIGLWIYYRIGRNTGGGEHRARDNSRESASPSASAVAKGTMHCGAGCTLGDIVAELLLVLWPSLAVAFGWRTLWSERLYSSWLLDFILAFLLGILFQYFSIKPMHPRMGKLTAVKRALQADTLSLVAWQVGMYGAMAVAHFQVFPHLLGVRLVPASLVFWWVMQFAMLVGFITAFPVNRWLIARGIKESM